MKLFLPSPQNDIHKYHFLTLNNISLKFPTSIDIIYVLTNVDRHCKMSKNDIYIYFFLRMSAIIAKITSFLRQWPVKIRL